MRLARQASRLGAAVVVGGLEWRGGAPAGPGAEDDEGRRRKWLRPRQTEPAWCLERRIQDAYQLLEPERPLGVGGHGVVFPGVNRSSGEIMAIKQVSKRFGNSESDEEAEALKKRVAEEAEVLRVAGEHRSICTYKEFFEGDEAFYLVTELARGGELFDRLVERGAYNSSGAASVMLELVDAVAYLHQMGIAHLDLKPENVLLASDETDASDVRLVDFGSARFIAALRREHHSKNKPVHYTTVNTLSSSSSQQAPVGATPAYAAPEVLLGDGCDEKADIWSLGVILYLLLTGTHPFDPRNDADDKEVTRRVVAGAEKSGAFEGPDWARVPRPARGLLRRLLASSPDDRPSAAEVSGHPWLLAPESSELIELTDDEDSYECADAAATRQAVDKLRQFHRGRRRFKALLLAVMLGYADDGLVRDRGAGTACLGSRRAAMEVFDQDQDGFVTADDVKRVAAYVGEDLGDADVEEMIRALDKHCRKDEGVAVPTARLRHLLPPLYPAHVVRRGDVVFRAGEIDPRFYILLKGDVLISHSFTIRPRSGFVHKSRTGRVLSPTDSDSSSSSSSSSSRGSHKGLAAALWGVSSGSSGNKNASSSSDDDDRDDHPRHHSHGGSPLAGRELSLGLHRLRPGQSFGETELLDAAADALPRASTATCASPTCELLSVPGHLFQLLSDVFDGIQDPLSHQAEARARMLVWSWVTALVAHAAAQENTKQKGHPMASRAAFGPGDQAWSNRAYAKDSPLGKSLDLLQKFGSNSSTTSRAEDLAKIRRPPPRAFTPKSAALAKPTRFDSFLVVEDGVVDVTVADARTGARRSHTLWPKDFVYCNERPGNHPLDAREEFASTVVVDVKAVTHCQLAFVPGDVFQQALNQPAMQFVKYYLVERFRELPPEKAEGQPLRRHHSGAGEHVDLRPALAPANLADVARAPAVVRAADKAAPPRTS